MPPGSNESGGIKRKFADANSPSGIPLLRVPLKGPLASMAGQKALAPQKFSGNASSFPRRLSQLVVGFTGSTFTSCPSAGSHTSGITFIRIPPFANAALSQSDTGTLRRSHRHTLRRDARNKVWRSCRCASNCSLSHPRRIVNAYVP